MTHLSILKKSIKYNSNPFHRSHSPIHLKYPKNITFHPLSISKESIECTPIFLTKIEENQNVDTLKMNPNPSSIVPPSLASSKTSEKYYFSRSVQFQFQKKYRSKRKSDLTCGFVPDDIREFISASDTALSGKRVEFRKTFGRSRGNGVS